MKQTAVDWLFKKMDVIGYSDIPTSVTASKEVWGKIYKKAKEMEKEQQKQMLIGLLDWMNKVAQDDPMAFETDLEDIVNMYLEAYYTEEK